MSLTLELSSVEERKLRDAAQNHGLQPEQLAHRLVFADPPAPASGTSACLQVREEMAEERRDWDNVTPRR